MGDYSAGCKGYGKTVNLCLCLCLVTEYQHDNGNDKA